MTHKKRLIINADDFGADRRVNEAVISAYRDGVLRFASLMVLGEAAEEAAALALENPGLGVGLHLELCAKNPAAWGCRFFFEPGRRAWIESEAVRQIERCLSWGLRPTHIDSHLNIHVHPVVFPILVRLAERYRIPRLRLPGAEISTSLSYNLRGAGGQLILAGVYGALGAYLRRGGGGLIIPQKTFGLLRSGLMTEDYLVWTIARLPRGLTEIYLHPSADPESEASAGPTPTHRSVSELRALTSPRVSEALDAAGVSLAVAGDFRGSSD